MSSCTDFRGTKRVTDAEEAWTVLNYLAYESTRDPEVRNVVSVPKALEAFRVGGLHVENVLDNDKSGPRRVIMESKLETVEYSFSKHGFMWYGYAN